MPLGSIYDVACNCPSCHWHGKVLNCEPDVDGDGSLGCPICGTVVDVSDVSNRKKSTANVEIDGDKLGRYITLNIKIKGAGRLRWRMAIACFLLRLAGYALGSKTNIEVDAEICQANNSEESG